MSQNWFTHIVDPLKLCRVLWPHVQFYKKQRDIIYSVVEDDETVCVAGNELGKDFTAGFLALYFMLTRNPVRIVTTSAKDDHLRVLWGEINRYIQTSKVPLEAKKGGPLICNHQDIRKVFTAGPLKGEKCPISYCIGMVASAEAMAAMQGHHVADTGDGIPRTLFIADECSSVPHEYKRMANTWAARKLLIGNAWECHNFFRHAVEGDPKTGDPGGDKPRKKGGGYHRRVIHIEATDSPNVRYALAQEEAGIEPTGEVIIPGVKTWNHYVRDLETMDPIQQCVSLRARFYKGKELMMFPEEWLQLAIKRAKQLKGMRRKAETMGIDTGEGTANTVWTIGDKLGIIKQIGKLTPNTNEIPNETIALIERYNLDPEKVFFDRGGGGKQAADTCRERGYNVQTVGFGESVTPPPQSGSILWDERAEINEERQTYLNRRAQMYTLLRNRLDPDGENETLFAIPQECHELIRQLSPIPLRYDTDGKIKMIPKDRKNPNSKELTLKDLLGCSPDEADSTVLMVYGLDQDLQPVEVGAL